MITQNTLRSAVMATALLGPWALAMAQEPTEEAPGPAIEPEALAALEKMGAFLNALQRFEVRAETTTDEVLVENGQKIQLGRTVEYRVQRPNHLFAEVASDRKHRQYLYDGETVTVYAPRMNYYAIFEAPATIGETLDIAEEEYGLDMPLRDLFVWGTDEADTGAITGALEIGPTTINGERCDHYAYRQEGVDWQLWVRQGEQPLPCKLVITTTSEEAQPQYSAVLSWNLNPSFDDQTFRFVPSEGAQRIAIAEREAEPATEADSNN